MSEALAFREKAEIEAKIQKIDAICGPGQRKVDDWKDTGFGCCLTFSIFGSFITLVGLLGPSWLFSGFGCLLLLAGAIAWKIPRIMASRFRARMATFTEEKVALLQTLEELRTPERLQQRLLEIASAKETLEQEHAQILKELEERRGTPYGREPWVKR